MGGRSDEEVDHLRRPSPAERARVYSALGAIGIGERGLAVRDG